MNAPRIELICLFSDGSEKTIATNTLCTPTGLFVFNIEIPAVVLVIPRVFKVILVQGDGKHLVLASCDVLTPYEAPGHVEDDRPISTGTLMTQRGIFSDDGGAAEVVYEFKRTLLMLGGGWVRSTRTSVWYDATTSTHPAAKALVRLEQESPHCTSSRCAADVAYLERLIEDVKMQIGDGTTDKLEMLEGEKDRMEIEIGVNRICNSQYFQFRFGKS
jgi:hypothetical protein